MSRCFFRASPGRHGLHHTGSDARRQARNYLQRLGRAAGIRRSRPDGLRRAAGSARGGGRYREVALRPAPSRRVRTGGNATLLRSGYLLAERCRSFAELTRKPRTWTFENIRILEKDIGDTLKIAIVA